MAKAYKENKVQVQKGPVVAHQPTMKSMTRAEVDRQDAEHAALRRDGMILKLHMPKQ